MATSDPTSRHRRHALAVVAAVVVIAGGVTAGALATRGSSSPAAAPKPARPVRSPLPSHTPPPSSACAGAAAGCGTPPGAARALAAGHWLKLPAAPLSARYGVASAWTGRQLIIWGGYGSRYDANGVAFTPATGRWTALPASPLSGRSDASSVWDGSAVLIWGGADGRSLASGAAYEPGARRWSELPASPLSPRSGATMLWTGRRVVVFGGTGSNGGLTSGATYAPSTRRWARLPAFPPVAGTVDSTTAVWTGSELVALVDATDIRTNLTRFTAATLTLGAAAWSRVASPPDAPLLGSTTATWDGRSVVLSGGEFVCTGDGSCGGVTPEQDLVSVWDTRTGGLTPQGSALRSAFVADQAWTGRSLVVFGGTDDAAFAGSGRAYRLPIAGAPAAGTVQVAAWTGRRLLAVSLREHLEVRALVPGRAG